MTTVIPYVSKLLIYPIKSLDSVSVERVTILKSGALKYDRQFAIFDESDHFVNGKRNARVHALRSQFDLETGKHTYIAKYWSGSGAEDKARRYEVALHLILSLLNIA